MTTYNTEPRAYTPEELQAELFEHLAYTVQYWVDVKKNYKEAQFEPFMGRISGYMHSFSVTFAGCSGGFNASIDTLISGTEEAKSAALASGKNYFPLPEDAVDINDGGWQYRSIPTKPDMPDTSELDANAPRQWTDEEMRVMLFNELTALAHKWEKRTDLHEYDALGGFVRDMFVLFEQGSENFPATIRLVVSGMQDNIDYWISNNENWVPLETDLDTPEKTALQAWDYWWNRSRKNFKVR